MTTKPKNHLSENHFRNPGKYNQVMTAAELRATILETSGRVLAWGALWDIKSKRLGPGAYRVWLVKYENNQQV